MVLSLNQSATPSPLTMHPNQPPSALVSNSSPLQIVVMEMREEEWGRGEEGMRGGGGGRFGRFARFVLHVNSCAKHLSILGKHLEKQKKQKYLCNICCRAHKFLL